MDARKFKEQFDEDGYVILRNFIPIELIDNARIALERIVDALAEQRVANGDIPHAFKDEPFELRFKKLFENEPDSGLIQFTSELHQPEFYDLYTYPRLLDLAQSYLGDELRVIIYVVRMRAFPNKLYESLWHQDTGYLGAGRGTSEHSDEVYAQLRYMNCWTPFQPVNRHNGYMQVIPGTHKLGVAKHVTVPPYNYLHIDFDLINPMIDSGQVVNIELNPGDVLIFQNLLFHQGSENNSGKLRWNADFRYQDARQPTLTSVNGHLVCSRAHPERVVSSREEWAHISWS